VLSAPVSNQQIVSTVTMPKTVRLGNGVVQRAVFKVLGVADQPLSVGEVQLAVEQLLGESVSRHSINWCLSTRTLGEKPRFERVARGCYRLRRY